MADSRLEEIFGRSINTAKELRQGIIDLQNTIKDLGTNEEALQKRVSDLNYAQEEYNKMINSAKQSTDFAKDSILGMEKEYKNLYNTYKMLNEEQRNSDFGKSMAESLNALSEKLNNTKKDVGNFKDNIGRYTQSTMDAFNQMGISIGALQTPMKLAAGGAKTLGASLKALIANPVGVVIMAIVAAFKALEAIVGQVKNAIDSNEESQMRLKEAMAAFQPIIDGVKNAFDRLAQGVVTVIEWISNAITTIRTAGAAFTDFVGITKGAKDAIEAQTAAYAGLAKAQNDYVKKQREVKAVNAKDSARVEELREQAMETDNATEKLKLLNEAKDIQAQIDERNVALAEENLRILQEESTHTANDATENEKLAEALAAVEQARAGAARNARTLTKAINSVTSATSKNAETLKKEKVELERVLNEMREIEEYGKSEEAKLTAKYQKEKALLEKYHKDTTLLTVQYNNNLDKIQRERDRAQLASLMSSKESFRNALNESISLDSALDGAIKKANDAVTKNAYAKSINDLIIAIFNDTDKIEDVGTEKYKEAIQKLFDEIKIETAEGAQSVSFILSQMLRIDPSTITNRLDWEAVVKNFENEIKVASKDVQASMRNLFDLQSEYDAIYAKMSSPFEKGSFERMDAEAIAEDELLQKKIQIRQLDLENFKGTEEEKLQLKLEVLNLQAEAEERAYQREMELLNLTKERNMNLVTDTQTSLQGLTSLIGGLQTLTEAQSKNDKMDEKEKAKKMKRLENLQKLQTAVAIASVIADTGAGMMSIWRGYADEKIANAKTAAGTGPAAAGTLAALNAKSLTSAILQSVGLAAMGAGQLAAIAGNHISGMASISQGSESGGTSATATPTAIIDSTPYSYTRTLQTAEESEELNKPIYVTVTDIENGLERNRVRIAETTF